MSASGPRIVVLVLTFNQRQTTLECLESLDRIEDVPFDVLVWDNGSTDGTADAIASAYPRFRCHLHQENLGVASGRNAAARMAIERLDPDLLLFLDNDMIVEPRFVSALAAPFAESAKRPVGQTQAKLRLMDRPELLNDGGGCKIRFWLGETRPIGFGEIDEGQYDTRTPCVACGGAMMVRRDLFERLGGFDSAFDPFGPEDLDFSLRLRSEGFVALYVPDAVAFHKVSHTFGGGQFSEMYAKHKARQWLLFMRRHASPLQQAGFLFLGIPWIALRVLYREGRKGNVSALKGLARGLLSFGRR